MYFTIFLAALLIPAVVVAYNPFRGGGGVIQAAPSVQEQAILSGFTQELDPTILLQRRPRKSDIYTKALVELKKLESQPACHRLATQLFMNNCRDVKELSDLTSQEDEVEQLPDDQIHQVESFATALTLCDLARGKFTISKDCSPFAPSTLLRVYQDGKRRLDVTREQASACIEALNIDPSRWINWGNNRNNALIFCRAVRLDIDKDETILLHKELTRLMAILTEDLETDLDDIKQRMEENNRAMESSFESALHQAEILKANVQETVEVLSNEVQGMSSSIKTAKGSTVDLQRLLKVLIETTMRSNAELAAGQEQALAATTDLASSRMAGFNAMAEETLTTMGGLRGIMLDHILPAVISISERQDITEKKAEILNANLDYMTYVISNHTEAIEQASMSAKAISLAFEKLAGFANLWNNMFNLDGPAVTWALRIGFPYLFLFFGTRGISSTLIRNALLLISGYAFAEIILIQLQPWNWKSAWLWTSKKWVYSSVSPSSNTPLVQENLGPLVTTPVDFELV